VVQSTPSGGMHLIFRCDVIEPNQILARGKDKKVLIETRGEGGYICIDPTPGYKVLLGSILKIPTITPEQRENLFTACRSLNEQFEEIRPPKYKVAEDLTPWDDFNAQGFDQVPALLEKHGWTPVKSIGENQHYCRPDKRGSTSGTWNGRTFYCFTSSTVFEPGKGYSPSALFAYLECGRDFSEAARRLSAMGFGEKSPARAQSVKIFRLTKPTQMERPKKLFGPLWAQGETAFLFAEDGTGKSILAVQIGCAIATGNQIPGFQNEVKPQPVTFFDAELSDFQFNTRYPQGLPDNFKRLTFAEDQQSQLVKADIQFVVNQIEQAANELGSKIIILDNLAALTSMIDCTKTSDSIQLMGLLNELKKKGFSILIIDHCRKPNRESDFKMISKHDLQGSKMKTNLVDSVFSIGKSVQGESYRYIKGLKIRSYEMAFTKNAVATMYLRTDPLRLDFVGLDAEWQHVNDRDSEMNRMAASGATQKEIAQKFLITQQYVSKVLQNDK
jgi:hypothetical protein